MIRNSNKQCKILPKNKFLTKVMFATFVRKNVSDKSDVCHFCQIFKKHEIPKKSMNKCKKINEQKGNMWLRCCDVLGNSLILRCHYIDICACFSGDRSDCERKISCLPACRRALPDNRLKSRCHDDAQLHNLACLCYMVTRKLYSQYTCSCNCAAEGRYDRHKRRLYCVG